MESALAHRLFLLRGAVSFTANSIEDGGVLVLCHSNAIVWAVFSRVFLIGGPHEVFLANFAVVFVAIPHSCIVRACAVFFVCAFSPQLLVIRPPVLQIPSKFVGGGRRPKVTYGSSSVTFKTTASPYPTPPPTQNTNVATFKLEDHSRFVPPSPVPPPSSPAVLDLEAVTISPPDSQTESSSAAEERLRATGDGSTHLGTPHDHDERAPAQPMTAQEAPLLLQDPDFPPAPLSDLHTEHIIRKFANACDPSSFEEAGCSACGQLKLLTDLTPIAHIKRMLHVLEAEGVMRLPRSCKSDAVCYRSGPVLDDTCNGKVCGSCRASIRQGKAPKFALCKGLWLGNVPPELKNLTFYERLLIARVRHSKCFIRVQRGGTRAEHSKLVANVIAFENPTAKIYDILPPPREDISEVLAVMFSGPCKPTDDDYKRSLLFVRRNVVAVALEWLMLNNSDYTGVIFSPENLATYESDVPIVSVEYFRKDVNRNAEGVSVHDNLEDDGIPGKECVFTVHGIIGEDLKNMSKEQIRVRALQHLDEEGKFLRTSHALHPESIWNNPQLYPKMFPWLFPYGHGGIGSTAVSSMSDLTHKKLLLLYHDKRFQTDMSFAFVAFSHEQIHSGSTQAYLLSTRDKFDSVSQRLLNINKVALQDIATRAANGEFVKPATDSEKQCFSLLRDLDQASAKTKGSINSKRSMQHELWSLVTYIGGPTWYFTLSPCDFKHPLCIYYAANEQKFDVPLRTDSERRRLLSHNPTAAARFFHFMVTLFLEIVIGDTDNPGLFGPTAAYFCTVEQQGRLTLHLHGVAFTKKRMSPLEMNQLIMNPASDFQTRLISYLESVRVGEFLTGTKNEVEASVAVAESSPAYTSPELTLPAPPPELCACNHPTCTRCESYKLWRKQYRFTVDDLLLKSNVHNCNRGIRANGSVNWDKFELSCLNNKYRKCKARFPRAIFKETAVDLTTGHVSLKKLEAWLNDISPALTYLMRCNTDVTCLLSGTAIKTVICYVADYITKTGLKTHTVFDGIRAVFEKNTELLTGSHSDKEKSRRLLTQMVNFLSTKLELGGPMINLYLLQNPDHYSSHKFVPFYWNSFVSEARRYWKPNDTKNNDKVVILRKNGKMIGLSSTFDYTHRPQEHQEYTLYNWLQQFKRRKTQKPKKRAKGSQPLEDDANNTDSGSASSDTSDNGDAERSSVKGPLHFVDGHPLKGTHLVSMRRDFKNCVPTFVGPPLPRPDKGDREDYCFTMLALFKPWRSGKDLKADKDQSWDEAFDTYQFAKEHILHIRNMNLRYECLDSRDDFRSQMKAEAANVEDEQDVGECLYLNTSLDGGEDPEYADADADAIILFDAKSGIKASKTHIAQEKAALELREILCNSGWNSPLSSPQRDIMEFVQRSRPPIQRREPLGWTVLIADGREAVLAARKEQSMQSNGASNNSLQECEKESPREFAPLVAEICDKSYFEKLGIEYGSIKKLVESVVQCYHLNTEQERAFRIVAQHVGVSCLDPLRMYIGGMGGTGKSEVINALLHFFTARKCRFAIVVTAPTGNAAALLSGSTYHFLLGFNGQVQYTSKRTLAEVCSRLRGVEYMVLDEVSMLSGADLYKISERLAFVRNKLASAFGSMNMIFAGDFAQLPPVGGESMSLYSHTAGLKRNTLAGNCAAIGKALWHQVTIVVILRKNMRNQGASEDDVKYRQALENMRYKSCTSEDVAFLKTLVSSKKSGRHFLGCMPWRNAPVIVAENRQKDEINHLGCLRFAADTNQSLTNFYCTDSMASTTQQSSEQVSKWRKKSSISSISPEVLQLLWSLPPSSHEHRSAPILSLCRGLPVLIRHNFATELNITKGQRAVVYDWHSSKGLHGKLVLDTLFVSLVGAPNDVKLPGLPVNVVPLIPRKNTGAVILPDGKSITVSRVQVDVLPGFAMTAYASQGHSMDAVTVMPNSLRDHHAYYTALSRSRASANTTLLQGFSPKVITGGATGSLRKEFRELELLDEITRLRYEGELDPRVQGSTRSLLIETFRQWKGNNFVPPNVHPSIKWSASEPYVQESSAELQWHIFDKAEFNKAKKAGKVDEFLSASMAHSLPQDSSAKCTEPAQPQLASKTSQRKHARSSEGSSSPLHKRSKSEHAATSISAAKASKELAAVNPSQQKSPNSKVSRNKSSSNHACPEKNADSSDGASPQACHYLRLCWSNNSCAYDAVFIILLQIWSECNAAGFDLYVHLEFIKRGFVNHGLGICSVESVRDDFRRAVAHYDAFKWGEYTSVADVMQELMRIKVPCIEFKYICAQGCEHRAPRMQTSSYLSGPFEQAPASTSAWALNIPRHRHGPQCKHCGSTVYRYAAFKHAPAFLAFSLDGMNDCTVDSSLVLNIEADSVSYRLRGAVYFDSAALHFTARIIDEADRVLIHDGMTNGGASTLENDHSIGVDMVSLGDGTGCLSALLYTKC